MLEHVVGDIGYTVGWNTLLVMVVLVSLAKLRSLSLLLLNTSRIAAEVNILTVLVGLGVAGGDGGAEMDGVVVALEGCIEEDVGGVVIVFLIVVVVACGGNRR